MTKLIIADAHKNCGRGTGVEHLLTELRSLLGVKRKKSGSKRAGEVSRVSSRIHDEVNWSNYGSTPKRKSTATSEGFR